MSSCSGCRFDSDLVLCCMSSESSLPSRMSRIQIVKTLHLKTLWGSKSDTFVWRQGCVHRVCWGTLNADRIYSLYTFIFKLASILCTFYCVFQAVCSGSGQLWHVQHGPAAPPALQGPHPPVLPEVAGEDLCPERHQSGAAGHSREVRPPHLSALSPPS